MHKAWKIDDLSLNLSKITRQVATIESLRFALFPPFWESVDFADMNVEISKTIPQFQHTGYLFNLRLFSF